VKLSVFDVRGRLVARLVDEPKGSGSYTVTWNGRNRYGAEVGTGVYFYRLQWNSQTISRRMVLLK
jgi:flagellar hook assembly protein FlgD